MGKLREKAEAEVESDRLARQERQDDTRRKHSAQHEEEARPTAEWLSRWAGMPVSPSALKREEGFFRGFHAYKTWTITIDGFHLVIKQEKRDKPMLEEHTPDYEFQLYQRLDANSDETRRIDKPADLLAQEAVAAP